MNLLDWTVVFIYFVLIVSLAVYYNRSQRTTHDYYLAGKRIKWWQSGASTMATQLSAISFISAPAFVAIKPDGGMKWLAYEFAVPLALIVVMAVIIPLLHRANYISIYEFLENRFDNGTRLLVSIFFQLGRGLATAVLVLTGGLILSTALSITTIEAILLVGIITIIYDVIGGIRIVILSDLFQMLIILFGILLCGGIALSLVGWEGAWQSLEPERLRVFDMDDLGFTSQGRYGFWPMLLGGFFLYISYYGCDQSQVQRELSVGDEDNVRKSLLVNAFGRFPLVLLYCLMGIFIGAVFTVPELQQQIADHVPSASSDVEQLLGQDPDRMVPLFILSFIPHGLIGFLFVAIMAALMSSLDSGINSLSAVTMKDIYEKYINRQASERTYLFVSKLITLMWGVFCISAAILMSLSGEATRQTTIVLINAIGSVLYGPILAAFLIGIFSRRIGASAIKTGIATGVAVNLFLWFFTEISWLWWNITGFLAVFSVSLFHQLFQKPVRISIDHIMQGDELKQHLRSKWGRIYLLVLIYFVIILLVAAWIEGVAM
jgi:SSS family transporter